MKHTYNSPNRPPSHLSEAAESLYQALLALHIVMDKYPETYQNGLYQASAVREQVVEALAEAEGRNHSDVPGTRVVQEEKLELR